jgi:hypothetical protein
MTLLSQLLPGVLPGASGLLPLLPMIRPQPFRDAAERGEGICVAELLDLHGRATLPALLLVVSVLSSLPLVGLGTVLSFAMLAIAWQWPARAGGGSASSPMARVQGLRLNAQGAQRCLRLLARLYELAGNLLRRRWLAWRHPRTAPIWRLWIGAMALLILLPMPLGNLLPCMSLVLLALGWIYRDGLALALSLVCGTAAVAFFAVSAHVLIDLARNWWPA